MKRALGRERANLSPISSSFFSLPLFFVCAPLSERLRQTTGEVNTVSPLMQSSSWGICTHFSAPRVGFLFESAGPL